MTAIASAGNSVKKFKGLHTLVLATIQPLSAIPDEDSVMGSISHAFTRVAREIYGGGQAVNPTEYVYAYVYFYLQDKGRESAEYQKAVTIFQTSLAELLKLDVRSVPRERAVAVLETGLARFAAYVDTWHAREALYRAVYNPTDDEKNRLVNQIPTRNEAENAYRIAVNALTRSTTGVAHRTLDSFMKTLRLTDDLGFRGRNRITHVLVVENYLTQKSGEPMRIRLAYQRGAVPDDFLNQWQSGIGHSLEWVRP